MPYWNEPNLTWDHPLARYDDPRTFAEILNQTPAMYNVILDTANLSVTDLIARLRAIIAGARGQAAYASLAPYLTALEAKVDALESGEGQLITAKSAVSAKTITRDTALDAVEDELPLLAKNLGEKATSEQDVVNADCRLKSAPRARPAPSQCTGLDLKVGDEDGELTGQCNGQPGIADLFEIEFTLTDPNLPTTVWQHAAVSQRSLFELKNLPTGQKVWVRIRASNTSGTSIWSDPACKRVP